jgi:hypothetical protein
MKTNNVILATSIAAYSYLFYAHTAGVNFLLFNCVLIVSLIVKNKTLLRQTPWLCAALGAIITACAIAYYSTTLAVVANVIALCVLSALSFNSTTSLLFSFAHMVNSLVLSLVNSVVTMYEYPDKLKNSENSGVFKKIILILLPFAVTVLFFFMYRASNALFNDLVNKINIDFISIGWILFTLSGVLLINAFYNHHQLKDIADFDIQTPNKLYHDATSTSLTLFGKPLHINDELFSGKVLFVLLNCLLLIVNMLDVQFMCLGQHLPKGVTYTDFVHQGTQTLILSIVLAIGIILFYFRGAINFNSKGNTIKYLAYLWIAQNIVMIASTALRTNMYVSTYGLTYKRIGVYVYLFLCVIGLLTTLIKLAQNKSNFYLFRSNGWMFYATLVLSTLVNWDAIITHFNTSKAKALELHYLVGLSYSNLPQLIVLQNNSLNNTYSFKTEYNDKAPTFNADVSQKLYNFLAHDSSLSWQSRYVNSSVIKNNVLQLNNNNAINTLDFSLIYEELDLNMLAPLSNAQNLSLNLYNLTKFNKLSMFKKLKHLTYTNHLNNKQDVAVFNGIETLTSLECLTINGGNYSNYTPITKLTHLKQLHINTSIDSTSYSNLVQAMPHCNVIRVLEL